MIIVWVKVSSTSYNGQLNELSLISVLFIVGWALAMHTLFIIINVVATIILRLPKDQQKCIIILASQKTMAVGVSVIAFLPETLGECIKSFFQTTFFLKPSKSVCKLQVEVFIAISGFEINGERISLRKCSKEMFAQFGSNPVGDIPHSKLATEL